MRRVLAVLAAAGGLTTFSAVAGPSSLAQEPGSLVLLAGTLSGATEVPGPGSPTTTGDVLVTIDTSTNEVCVEFTLENQTISAITDMHIHEAPEGSSGPPVVGFAAPAEMSCAAGDPAIVTNLVTTPEQFYFNLHSAAYPDGEVRAQLSFAPEPEPVHEPAAEAEGAAEAGAIDASPRFTG